MNALGESVPAELADGSERLVLWHRHTLPEGDERARWEATVIQRLEGLRGTQILGIENAIVFGFDLIDLVDALDVALVLLDDAEDRDSAPEGVAGSFGACTGRLGSADGPQTLSCASALATGVPLGSLALDEDTKALVSGEFLFRQQQAIPGSPVGFAHPIDRELPHRSACRFALADLEGAGSIARLDASLSPLRALVGDATGRHRLCIDAPDAAPPLNALVEAIVAQGACPLFVDGHVGGLEPYGSLRHALLGASDAGQLPDEVMATLAPLLAGTPLRHKAAVALVSMAFLGHRPWFFCGELRFVDEPTRLLLAEVQERIPGVLVMLQGEPPSRALLPIPGGGRWHVLRYPTLTDEEALEVARRVLGRQTPEDIVGTVATLGSETIAGIEEAAKLLVATGALVHDGDAFRWRVGAYRWTEARPHALLLQERLAMLDTLPRRLLELRALVPQASLLPLLCHRDGLSEKDRREATSLLRQEQLLDVGDPQRVRLLRRLVVQDMHPARRAELHRHLAELLAQQHAPETWASASVAFSLALGGVPEAAAERYIGVAELAQNEGHTSCARRLSAVALRLHTTRELRHRASAIHRSCSPSPEYETKLSEVAVDALLRGDIDQAERTVESAIADGRDLAAAGRIRAMAYLAKGETNRALAEVERLSLQRQHDDERSRARGAVTVAWIMLHQGKIEEAVAHGLSALAASRRLKDPRGEAAALHTLAAAYRTLGWQYAAEQLDDASPA